MAIKNFSDKEAQLIFSGAFSRKLPEQIQRRARRCLLQLDAAVSINDLRLPPSNNLEILAGQRKNLYSIRINQQFRICFNWLDGEAGNVAIIDYH